MAVVIATTRRAKVRGNHATQGAPMRRPLTNSPNPRDHFDALWDAGFICWQGDLVTVR